MIRICTERDRKWILDYLYQDAAYNIFIIGDIEHFGFDSDFQQVYVETEQDEIKAVFLRYRTNAVYYSKEIYFNPEFIKIFKQYELLFISGKTEIMKEVYPYIQNYEEKPTYFCATYKYELKIRANPDLKIKKLTSNIEDINRLYDLLSLITEFAYSAKDRNTFIEEKISSINMGDTYYIEEDDMIVSTVAVTAETTINGMVVAVATHPNYRNKGYARLLMTHLMDVYLNRKNKDLCLFYDNPKAGHIYISLGFKPIGTWSMFKKISDAS